MAWAQRGDGQLQRLTEAAPTHMHLAFLLGRSLREAGPAISDPALE